MITYYTFPYKKAQLGFATKEAAIEALEKFKAEHDKKEQERKQKYKRYKPWVIDYDQLKKVKNALYSCGASIHKRKKFLKYLNNLSRTKNNLPIYIRQEISNQTGFSSYRYYRRNNYGQFRKKPFGVTIKDIKQVTIYESLGEYYL